MVSSAKNPRRNRYMRCTISIRKPVSKAAGHRILALNRGEKEKILTVKIDAPEDRILQYLEKKVIVSGESLHSSVFKRGNP